MQPDAAAQATEKTPSPLATRARDQRFGTVRTRGGRREGLQPRGLQLSRNFRTWRLCSRDTHSPPGSVSLFASIGPHFPESQLTLQQGEPSYLAELAESKRFVNKGFGLIPVFNEFSHPDRFKHEHGPPIKTPLLPLDDSNVVLVTVTFKRGRIGLYQSLDVEPEGGDTWSALLSSAAERGEPLEVVISMDAGKDLATLERVQRCELTPGISTIPFMPIQRLATEKDLEILPLRAVQEERILRECLRLTQTQRNTRLARLGRVVTIEGVELQWDGSRLILFVTMQAWVNFNVLNHRIKTFCENQLDISPFIWIQRRFAPPASRPVSHRRCYRHDYRAPLSRSRV